MDIGIVGAGFSGTACALFAAHAGHRATLYERVAEPGPRGAGILLQPTGMAALQRLGMLDRVLARAAPVDRLRARTPEGRTVLDLAYSTLAPPLVGAGLHRGALFEALFEAARIHPAIDVRCGVEMRSIGTSEGGRVSVSTETEKLADHDLVIVADGARSTVKVQAGPGRRTNEYPWGALWVVLEDSEAVFSGELHQVVDGTQSMLGFLPTGFGPPSRQSQVPLVSLFWSIRLDQIDALKRGSLGRWKERLLNLEPRTESLLPQIEDFEQLLCASYHDVRMDSYHGDRVVYLGDAAHAMSPQLGQGANLGLFDALVLTECLNLDVSLEKALATYSRRRRSHLAYYQWATRWLTPFFQSDHRSLGVLRDALLGWACRLPGVRDLMLRSLVGVQLQGLGRVSTPELELLLSGATAPRLLLERAS